MLNFTSIKRVNMHPGAFRLGFEVSVVLGRHLVLKQRGLGVTQVQTVILQTR